jgi:hypothetical protein
MISLNKRHALSGFEPGSSDPEAVAMPTAPRRQYVQSFFFKFRSKSSISLFIGKCIINGLMLMS